MNTYEKHMENQEQKEVVDNKNTSKENKTYRYKMIKGNLVLDITYSFTGFVQELKVVKGTMGINRTKYIFENLPFHENFNESIEGIMSYERIK